MKMTFAAAIAAVLCALTMNVACAQSTLDGTWAISSDTFKASFVRLTISSSDAGGEHDNERSDDIELSSLGLARTQLDSSRTDTAFTIAREAGSIACKGTLSNGSGSGVFTFTPSAVFLAKMRDGGYNDISPRKQMALAFVNVTTAYIDDVAAAGYPHIEMGDLIAFRALNIDRAYIHAMHALFASSDLDAGQIIALHSLDVSDTYVSQMRAAGIQIDDAGQAVSLKSLGIDLAYAQQLSGLGYPHLSSDKLIELRSLGIDGDYVKRVHAHGFPHPTVDQLVQMKSMGVF